MIRDDGYFVILPNGGIGLTHGRTRTGRIRCFVFSCVRRSYLEKSLRYATIAEAKRQGVYGTGGRYIEEDEPR
jgi:hypothetical protein